MHDGSMKTLEEVIDWYDKGGGDGVKSDLLFKLGLSANEKQDLLAFLHSLSGRIPSFPRPNVPAGE